MNWAGKGLLTVGLIISGFFAGTAAVSKFVAQQRTIHVKGLAEVEVKSDLGVWQIPIEINSASLDEGKRAFQDNIDKTKRFLIEGGLKEEEISINSPGVALREYNAKVTYAFSCNVSVRTKNVDLLESLSKNLITLLERGVMIRHERWEEGKDPTYFVKNFDAVRPPLVSESIKSALKMAEQLSKDLNVKITTVKTGDQGTIEELHPSGESNGRKSIIKKLRLVSHFTFFVE